MIPPRVFNSISVKDGILTKTSTDDSLSWEACWYRNVPSAIRRYTPKIYSADRNRIAMEYIDGRTLHESYISGEFGREEWGRILDSVCAITDEMQSYCTEPEPRDIWAMYHDKTVERLMRLRDHPVIGQYFRKPPVINGVPCPSVLDLTVRLRTYMDHLMDCDRFTIIHGDLHFANMIRKDDEIFMVDPRGKFGMNIISGDPRYDIAKLYHSIEGGYDFIIEDMFYLDTSDGIDYSIDVPEYGFDMMELIRERFHADEKAVRLIESLLFLSMIPLHPESVDRQTVMFARGMELFMRAIQ